MAPPPLDPAIAPAVQLHSVKEACALLGLGKKTFYALLTAQELDHVRIGRRTLIPADTLHAFISRQRRTGRAVPTRPFGARAGQPAAA